MTSDALEDIYADALTALRADDMASAAPLIDRIATACGTTPAELRGKLDEALLSPDADRDLLYDLEVMGSLMQLVPPQPTGGRVFNFAIPERGDDGNAVLADQPAGDPASIHTLFR